MTAGHSVFYKPPKKEKKAAGPSEPRNDDVIKVVDGAVAIVASDSIQEIRRKYGVKVRLPPAATTRAPAVTTRAVL